MKEVKNDSPARGELACREPVESTEPACGELAEPAVFGRHPGERLVAVELAEPGGDGRLVNLFFRGSSAVERRQEPFEPFLLAENAAILHGCPETAAWTRLAGAGRYAHIGVFPSWRVWLKAKAWLSKKHRQLVSAPDSPVFLVNDPVQQYLLRTGRTLFKGLAFEDLRRMQVDIETTCAPGFEFSNAEREQDRIIVVALGDSTGWTEVLSDREGGEKALLERFVRCVQERDPDVIEGHNIFKFDLAYIETRARRHGVVLGLGRDNRPMQSHPSRWSAGERTIGYPKAEIYGRHVIDTLFLAQAYDVSHRSLDSLGLKSVAIHFRLARPGRVYLEGSDIAREYARNPDKVIRYAADDIRETRELSALLSRSYFEQAQMLPLTYQDVGVKGNGSKIDLLMVREYLRRGQAIPSPDAPRPFAGGATDIFVKGVVKGVHHCDVRSLYPTLMLTRRLTPRSDELGVFLQMLDVLRRYRLDAKARMQAARAPEERAHWEALQTTFKILINSFYGYLGFAQGHFSDFSTAGRVAADGRELLAAMLEWLKKNGAQPIEIDTDGIYYTPPPGESARQTEAFRKKFESVLPDGIEVEFDDEYAAMFSYKMKNYALLSRDGEIVIKGAALKSRGLEPYLRGFLRDYLRLKLEGREAEIGALRAAVEADIRQGRMPIARLAKTETLSDAPATYREKIEKKSRGKNAAYELALASGRPYQAGDQISYYITGTKKNVPAHTAARLVSEWKADARDENADYYAAKLNALLAKLEAGDEDGAEGEPAEELL
ncbi:MAG: DNA polymerase II [Lentisphaerae bacterium]|nr:DNA polymerase II [Lentisphaerota bacterium]